MLESPFLKRITVLPDKVLPNVFPFSRLQWLREDFELEFTAPITILAGENGSGKSTFLEAIAHLAGFPAYGGSRNHHKLDNGGGNHLSKALRASWLPKVTRGFFFRAESFAHFSDYIDREGMSPTGRLLQTQSHGESFLSTFMHRFKTNERSIYIMDEPEAALSPQRMGVFLKLLDEWQNSGRVQAIIASHSPMLMGLPGADLRMIRPDGIAPVALRDVPHFRQLSDYFADPETYYDEVLNKPLPDDDWSDPL